MEEKVETRSLESVVEDAKNELDALEKAFAAKSAENATVVSRPALRVTRPRREAQTGIRAGQPVYGVHKP